MSERSVVWILGAGFSRPLGGPLLTELYGPGSEGLIGSAYGDFARVTGTQANLVRRLYDFGGGRPWHDAEEFLDYIDSAASARADTPTYKRLAEMLSNANGTPGAPPVPYGNFDDAFGDINGVARNMLAAECCAFLEKVPLNSEKFRPFHRWASELQPQDTVISFNYDLVVEQLFSAAGCAILPKARPLDVLLPGRARGTGVLFLKLHGSVNWQRNKDDSIAVHNDDSFAVHAGTGELAIATPGPSKLAGSEGRFRTLWTAAREAITKADAVVFVGYRFPPSDAYAREQLLGALRESKPEPRKAWGDYSYGNPQYGHVQVHTALGPEIHDKDQLRLGHMIRTALTTFRREEASPTRRIATFGVNQHPLYSQDFFSLVDRLSLFSRIENE